MRKKNYYQEKIIREINTYPPELMPSLYRIIRLFEVSWKRASKKKEPKKSSLKGIWRGSHIEDYLFEEAKQSIFRYESK